MVDNGIDQIDEDTNNCFKPHGEVVQTNRLTEIAAHLKFVIFLLVVAVISMIGSEVAMINFINKSQTGGFSSDWALQDSANSVDQWSQVTGYAFLAIFVWSAITISVWTFRAMKNVRQSGYVTTVSPGWAVGWYFIPVAFLWMPFRGMAQIWRATFERAPTGKTALPSTMRWWWAFFLLSNFSAQVSTRMMESALVRMDMDALVASGSVGVLWGILQIASALLILNLITRITEQQKLP